MCARATRWLVPTTAAGSCRLASQCVRRWLARAPHPLVEQGRNFMEGGGRMRRMRRQVFKFCRSKCHNNFKMKRNPRKVAWTKAYRAGHGKDLSEDATFDLERRRNRPEKYNRVLVHKSVKAMKKILDIRKARQDRFYENRCAAAPPRPPPCSPPPSTRRQRRRRRESAAHSARLRCGPPAPTDLRGRRPIPTRLSLATEPQTPRLRCPRRWRSQLPMARLVTAAALSTLHLDRRPPSCCGRKRTLAGCRAMPHYLSRVYGAR